LLEADGEPRLLRLAARRVEHRRRQIDPGHPMTARRQFEAQKAGAAADIERLQPAMPAVHQSHDPVPGGTLGGGGDAVAEILVEMRRAPIPMGGDLLLDRIGMRRRRHHLSPVTSASASTCSE
jgi:hypothetical protein